MKIKDLVDLNKIIEKLLKNESKFDEEE